ncbi:MAG: prolipoprotein diacylglyceryl transferase [Firmicutes bacterium]|nr:prolipoprotein diacylglyceryl transferase [Bacillota bacterium]
MYPSFTLFDKTIPSYWICALAGLAACCIAALIRHKRFKELQEVDITNSAALGLVGMILGGRVLYLLRISPLIVKNFSYLKAHPHLAYEVLSNGMVFYGGLFGVLAVLLWYCRKYRLDRAAVFDYYAPLFPLFHAFGRVGCFLTGCCHGMVCQRFGIAFVNSPSAENGVPYFPVQLLGSLGNLCLFGIVLAFERKHHKSGQALPLYLLLYAIGRFLLEFLRGDTVRGVTFGLSTSQWISLGLLLALAIVRYRIKKGREAQPQSGTN